MPLHSDALRKFVLERWPGVLVDALLDEPELRKSVRIDQLANRKPLDYGGIVDEAVVSEALSKRFKDRKKKRKGNGPEKLRPRLWARNLNRWLRGERVPDPESIRKALSAIRVDWVAGLAEAGYQQHALCLIHVMDVLGHKKRARAEAQVFLTSRGCDRDEMLRKVSVQQFDELAYAVATAWPKDDGGIPRRALPPVDMPASEGLYEAWMLLEAAMFGRQSLHRDLTAVQPSVERAVSAWLSSQSELKPRLSPHPLRRKRL